MALIDQPTTLFPIPVSIHYFGKENSKLNSDLVKDILTEISVDPEGTDRSNIGGWHSAFGMDGKYDSFSSLSKIIEYYGNKFCNSHGFYDGLKFSNMWANVSGPGDMNSYHHHGTDPLSGVYYPIESISDAEHYEVVRKLSATKDNPNADPHVLKEIETEFKNLSKKKIKTIGLLGSSGGQIKQMVDVPICVPSDKTEHIQEAHIMISHILCRYIEDSLFSLE